MNATPGTWHDDAPSATVPMARAKDAWAREARGLLQRIAGTYQATITYQELADEVRDATGYRTRMLVHYWIGDVLGRVARACHADGEPLLPSLCVDATGSVGKAYGVTLAETYSGQAPEAPEDLDDHAAHERLACYRHFGAVMPADLPDRQVGGHTPDLR